MQNLLCKLKSQEKFSLPTRDQQQSLPVANNLQSDRKAIFLSKKTEQEA
jgi:hypothetical protein